MALLKKNNLGDRPNDFVSVAGSGIKQEYIGKLDKETGIITLVPTKKRDMYAEIQSWKDSCDINKIVDRYRNGEIDILNQVQGTFGDFSTTPKDLADAYRMARDAEIQFESLPVAIKDKFDNNVYKWLQDVGSDDWLRDMTLTEKEQAQDLSQEKKEGVVE